MGRQSGKEHQQQEDSTLSWEHGYCQEAGKQQWLRWGSNWRGVHSCYGNLTVVSKLKSIVTMTGDFTSRYLIKEERRDAGVNCTLIIAVYDGGAQVSTDISDEGMMEMWCHTADYYSAFKRSSNTCGKRNKPCEKNWRQAQRKTPYEPHQRVMFREARLDGKCPASRCVPVERVCVAQC